MLNSVPAGTSDDSEELDSDDDEDSDDESDEEPEPRTRAKKTVTFQDPKQKKRRNKTKENGQAPPGWYVLNSPVSGDPVAMLGPIISVLSTLLHRLRHQ